MAEDERTLRDEPETQTPSSPEIEDAAAPTPEDERVEKLLTHTIDVPVLAEAVERQEAADAADTLEQLTEGDAVELLERMDDQSAADALAEMQRPLAAGVLEDLLVEDRGYAARLLELTAPDDAADLLQAVPPEHTEALLAELPAEIASTLRRLIGYHEESAGGLMTTDYPALRSSMTVAEAIEAIRARPLPEDLLELPVVDVRGRLEGMVGLRALLIGRPEDRIGSLVRDSVRAVRHDLDREQVALEFDRYDHALLPVIDDQDRLLGVVTVDDVIDIIRAEQTEDVQRTVGAGAGEAVYSGIAEKFRGRFPWLGASLVLTAAASMAVLFGEDLIRERPILAFLMPVIAALVGNAGHQALAVTLRGIVLDEIRPDQVGPLVLREIAVGLLSGLVLGLVILVGLGTMSGVIASASWQVGAVAGIATAVAMSVGTLAGTCIPLLMRRLGTDPAHASAIFLIMVTDGMAFTVLLGLTFFLL